MSDPVIRLNVALQGRYRVERELGESGMGLCRRQLFRLIPLAEADGRHTRFPLCQRT